MWTQRAKIHRIGDLLLSQLYFAVKKESSSLISIMFHSVYADKREEALNTLCPGNSVTTEQLHDCLRYFSSFSYVFVSPDHIRRGLPAGSNYVLVTFDDGYYNNIRALPILEEFDAPGVFFISTTHVKKMKPFWWDVVYRERSAQGRAIDEISHEIQCLTTRSVRETEQYVLQAFGKAAIKPRGDLDRPFTPSELRVFARERCVFLGNHTCDHAFLPSHSTEEINEQLRRCQEDILEMTNVQPCIISYPYGAYDETVIGASRRAGLQLGLTVEQRKDYLPISDPMRLGRFSIREDQNTEEQCKIMRSGLTVRRITGVLHRRRRISD
jgi:peptidoglycan/xylan/chitin deacetylase (PgdA/CDA1 family)